MAEILKNAKDATKWPGYEFFFFLVVLIFIPNYKYTRRNFKRIKLHKKYRVREGLAKELEGLVCLYYMIGKVHAYWY